MQFPTEPTIDQVYLAPNGKSYKWDGEKWTAFVAEAPPITGPAGPTGPQGPAGANGAPGPTGPQGSAGADGTNTAAIFGTGQIGDIFVGFSTEDLSLGNNSTINLRGITRSGSSLRCNRYGGFGTALSDDPVAFNPLLLGTWKCITMYAWYTDWPGEGQMNWYLTQAIWVRTA
jgi:hypothetical protein